MKRSSISILAAMCLAIPLIPDGRIPVMDATAANNLLGRWTNQNESKEPAVIKITSIDAATGRLAGRYYPASGAAAGKEFEIVGWVSSAAPAANRDNVMVISFSVSLSTYGTIATWTGFLKESKIIAASSNVRSNSGYEWDHITATYDAWTKNP